MWNEAWKRILVANDAHSYEGIGLYNQMHPVVNPHVSTVKQDEKKIKKNNCSKNLSFLDLNILKYSEGEARHLTRNVHFPFKTSWLNVIITCSEVVGIELVISCIFLKFN